MNQKPNPNVLDTVGIFNTTDDTELIVNVSPHITSGDSTRTIMRDVLIALAPAAVAGCVLFGLRALAVMLVTVGFAVLSEWGFQKLCKVPTTVCDCSAIVTGLILGMNLPVGIPLWQAAIGSIIAIVIVKQMFGGIGQNFANPAATARVIMLLAFAQPMTNFTTKVGGIVGQNVDALSGATALARLHGGEPIPSYVQLLLGNQTGSLGETCTIALLVGLAYLLIRGVITWHAPAAFVVTVAAFSAVLGGDPLAEILSGGVMIAAVFMITDYTTTPMTSLGRLIFGFGCGILTVLIRFFGNYSEGVSFSILLMNILTPYINKWTAPKPVGGVEA